MSALNFNTKSVCLVIQQSRQNVTQMIKMPEKLVLLELLYFEDLAESLKVDHPILMNFLRTICLISNKVTNDPQEMNLEDIDIPDCTDCSLLQGKKRVLKIKIRALLSIFEMLGVVVDSFCSGEKILMRKRHYPSLFTQLISNSEQAYSASSSEEVHAKLYEILELLSIMFENNLIKAFNKANKHAAIKDPVSSSKIKSAKDIRETVLEQEDSLKRAITECQNPFEECGGVEKQDQNKEFQRSIGENEGIQEEKCHDEEVNLQIQNVNNSNLQQPEVSEKDLDMPHENILAKPESSHNQPIEQSQKQQLNASTKEQLEIEAKCGNISNNKNNNNIAFSSSSMTKEESEKLEEQQKLECLFEIFRQNELEQEEGSFLEINSQTNISLLLGDESTDPALYSTKRQTFLRGNVEIITQRLCAVNLSNLVFKLIPNEQTSESDDEYYEVDEKENFHYSIELKDYDIAEALGDGFKFEPSLYISNQSNQQTFSASSSQQTSPFQQDLNQQNSYQRRNNKRLDYHRQPENDYQSRQSDDSPTDYDQQYRQIPEFINSNRSTNVSNSHRQQQQQSHRGNNAPGQFQPQLMPFPSFNNPYQQVMFWGNNPSMLPKNSSNRSAKNYNAALYDNNSINHNMPSGCFPGNNQDYSNNNNNNSNTSRAYNLHSTQHQNYNYYSNAISNLNYKNPTSNNSSGNNHNARQFYSNYNISGNGQQQQQPNGSATSANQTTKTHQKHKKRYNSKGKRQGDTNMNQSSPSSEQQTQNLPANVSSFSSNKGNSTSEKMQHNQNTFTNSSSKDVPNMGYHTNQTKPKARSKRINPGSKHFEFNQISSTQAAATTTTTTTLVPQGNQLKRSKELN